MPIALDAFLSTELEELTTEADEFGDPEMIAFAECEDDLEVERQPAIDSPTKKTVSCGESCQALCRGMIANAIEDVLSFAKLCERYHIPPMRLRDRSNQLQSLNGTAVAAESYEEKKQAAAQSLSWLFNDTRCNGLSFTFAECAEHLDCGKSDMGLDGLRRLLLGKLPITAKFLTAMLEFVEESDCLNENNDETD